jgi:hypothetical protein
MTESQTMHAPDDDYQRDLHPDSAAEQSDERMITAYDCKDAHRRWQHFNDDELKQIPVLAQGTRLRQGSTYLDLYADPPHEFTAAGGQTAGQYNLYVPKSETDYQVWNRLLGIDNPERRGDQ